MSVCNDDTPVWATGSVMIISSGNYLPGYCAGVIALYSTLFAVAVLTAVALMRMVCVNSKADVLGLHWQMLSLLPFLVCFYALQIVFFSEMKKSGAVQQGLMVSVIVFGTLAKTAIRTLILPLCLGLGITTPTLSKRTWLIIALLGLMYACFTAAYNILLFYLPPVEELTSTYAGWTTALNLCSTIVNVILWVYIWEALTDTMKRLKRERQFYKLKTFKRFRAALIAVLATAFALTVVALITWQRPWIKGVQYTWILQDGWVEVRKDEMRFCVSFYFILFFPFTGSPSFCPPF